LNARGDGKRILRGMYCLNHLFNIVSQSVNKLTATRRSAQAFHIRAYIHQFGATQEMADRTV